MRWKPTVRVFEGFFIRYGVNTYSCMRCVSLTLLLAGLKNVYTGRLRPEVQPLTLLKVPFSYTFY